ncbi:hypothetical protein FRC12_024309, partial [Ceratobasidium sp. 428]
PWARCSCLPPRRNCCICGMLLGELGLTSKDRTIWAKPSCAVASVSCCNTKRG